MKRKFLYVLAAVLILVGGVLIYQNTRPDGNQALLEEKEEIIETEPMEEEEDELKNSYLLSLRSKAPDVVAWIDIFGTPVNYPVVQGEDNEYYLAHNAFQKEDAAGALYMDYEVPLEDRPTNIILYGHNMKNGGMFGSLIELRGAEPFAERSDIKWETPYETATFHIVGVSLWDLTDQENFFPFHQYIDIDNQEDLDLFLEEMKARALQWEDESFTLEDQMMTLVTCTYETADARLLILAKKVDSNLE